MGEGRFLRSVSGIGSVMGTHTPNSIGSATHPHTGTASLSGSKLGSMLSCLKQSRQGGDLNPHFRRGKGLTGIDWDVDLIFFFGLLPFQASWKCRCYETNAVRSVHIVL